MSRSFRISRLLTYNLATPASRSRAPFRTTDSFSTTHQHDIDAAVVRSSQVSEFVGQLVKRCSRSYW